jgi:hypothetical protein
MSLTMRKAKLPVANINGLVRELSALSGLAQEQLLPSLV